MARICIISPGQIGSNPRTVKEADALVAAGHDVTVIATKVMPQVEARDQSIIERAKWQVVRVPFEQKLGRMMDRALQELGSRLFHLHPSPSLAAIAHSEMTRRLTAAAKGVKAELYIAHYVAALPAAVAAARRNGGQYAFDAEDFHPGDLPDRPQNDLARAVIDKIERQWLSGAAYVSAASPGIADAYHERYGIPLPEVVLNVFPLDQAPANPSDRGTRAKGFPSIYWFSQTIGPDRGLECAVEAISLAKSAPSLSLRGMISDQYRAELMALADKGGVADRVNFLPPANPDEMVRLAAEHDIGLVSETGHSHNRSIALTNKQFTYLLAGVPALMSDIPAHRDFSKSAAEAAGLYTTDDPASLARAMDNWLCDAGKLAELRSRAYELGQASFNWELESEKLLKVVENALSGTEA